MHARAVALGEVLLCSSVPTQVSIGYILLLAGIPPLTPDGQLSLTYVLALSLLDTAALILLMVMLTRSHGHRVSDLWLGNRPIVREAALGLWFVPVVYLMVVVVLNVVRLAVPWLRTVPVNPLEELAATGTTEAALLGLVAIIAGGIREELQRAFLLVRFERHLGGTTVGIVVLSVAFGLGHWVQGLDAVVTTGLLGAFWAVMYVKRRSSVAPIVSHAGFNGLEILRVALTGRG
jgi:membrane protease YdiL (CAAX protease family)